MKELQHLLEALKRRHRGGRRLALATVVEVSGSTYRSAGARMLICEDKSTAGTISGGCLEGDVLLRGLKALATGMSEMITYDTTSEADIFWGTGMGCGGKTTVMIQPLDEAAIAVYLQLLAAIESNRPVVLVTPYPGETGDKNIIRHPFLVGGKASDFEELPPVMRPAAEAAFRNKAGSSETVETDGRQFKLLIEYISPAQPLIIFGGEHDVLPVLQLGRHLGWRVTVVDRREALAVPENFPGAEAVIHWAEGPSPTDLHLNSRTVAVIMTHHYLTDKLILKHLLPSQLRYIGLMGPADRTEKLLRELREEGLTAAGEQLQRLYYPIGLDIGGETPEAVALSIIAEIQAVIHGRSGAPLGSRSGRIHLPNINK